MRSDFDQAADSKARRESEQALDERGQNDIDTARQSLLRMQEVHRQNIDFYVRLKVLLGVLLVAGAILVVFCARYSVE